MRIVLASLIIFGSFGAYALDGCPGAHWTKNKEFKKNCEGIACFERRVKSESGATCGRVVYTVHPGYFTSNVYNADGVVVAKEHFQTNPDGEGYLRSEIMNADGKLMYYLDSENDSYLPDGSPLLEDDPNPVGDFYDQFTRVP